MHKVSIILAFIFVTGSGTAQDYFEMKTRTGESLPGASMVAAGSSQFDYSSLSAKTLLIPKHDPKSLYAHLVPGDQYDVLKTDEEKESLYKSLWTEALEASSFSECKFSFEDVGYAKHSAERRQNLLWLSYYSMMGHYYYMIWYVNKAGEPVPCAMNMINGLDLAAKNDLRLMCDFIQQSLTGLRPVVIAEPTEVFEVSMDSADKVAAELFSSPGEELTGIPSKNPASRYVSESQFSTLLLPLSSQGNTLDNTMESWNYSAVEYVSEAAIQEKIDANDSRYCYIRTFEPDPKTRGIATMCILNCKDHRIMFKSMIVQSSCASMPSVMTWMRKAIASGLKTVDYNSTITYIPVDFKYDGLPENIATSKIVYLKLTYQETRYADFINLSFKTKMIRYPFEYEIAKKPNAVKKAQYRVYLKGTFKSINQFNADLHRPDHQGIMDKARTFELFSLYLEDTKTGECYRITAEPGFYHDTFAEFIKAARALKE
jgi:hypothetical protein